MKTEKIELYSKFERFWHWTQGVLVILLGVTGFEIHDTFKLFGYEAAVRLHSAAAWAFLILVALAMFWMFISKQYLNFIPTSKNFKAQVNYYLSGLHSYAKGDPVPVPPFIYWMVGIVFSICIAAYFGNRRKKSIVEH